MPWEGRRERAGFSCLSFYLEVVSLPPPGSPPYPSSRASVKGKVARLSLAGQGSLPFSDVLSCVCSLSPFNVQGQKAPSVGDLSGGGAAKKVQNFPFPVQSRTGSHSPQGAYEFGPIKPIIFVSTPKSGGLEQSTFGRVSRRSFKIMRALNLASLFSPQPLQWLPLSLEKKAEAEGPPTTPLSHCCSVTPCCGHALVFGHIAYLLFLNCDKHPLQYTPPPVSI